MATFTAQVTVAPLDLKLLTAVIPAVLRRLRLLTFADDGCLVHHGRRIEGLQVDRGAHPRVGACYTAVVTPAAQPAPDPLAPTLLTSDQLTPDGRVLDRSAPQQPAPDVIKCEIVADDARQTALRIETGPPASGFLLAVQNPVHPTGLRCEFVSSLAGTFRWLDGPVTATATMALDGFEPGPAPEPQVTADAEHRRGRGTVSARVDGQPDGSWLVTARLDVHGRGLLRPVVGVAARYFLRSRWQELVDELPRAVAEFRNEIPPGEPDELAETIVDELIDALVPELPAGIRA